jgi:hypothetical protein
MVESRTIMPRDFDDDSDWAEDDSDESSAGFEYGDDATVPCPYCRREILEDIERCPYCENYISAEDAPFRIKPMWMVIAAVLCLIAMGWWIVV